MVIRILAVPNCLDLFKFDEVFRAILGWDNIGFLFHVHGQEFNSFRRATRSRTLREFQLRPSETFRYTCGAIELWDWEVRLLDEEPGSVNDDVPLCLGGRGTAPPQFCGGPTVLGMLAATNPEAPPETWRSYREMLKEGFVSIDRRLQEFGPLEPERFNLDEANQRLARREGLLRWRRV